MPKHFDAAKKYLNKGWIPIPISYKQKAPKLVGWQNLMIEEKDLPQYFKGAWGNIGIVLGEKSKGLTDIDLDSPEAVIMADFFLPPTEAIFGRKSKPRSHRLYYSDFPKIERFDFGSTIVEIRSTGGQTVFPPSRHEKGEDIEWENEGEPLSIDQKELRSAVALLASACVISKFWQEGIRHELSLAIGGVLLRNGYSVSDTQKFIKAICTFNNDDEVDDRLKCVKTNSAALKNNENVYGLPKLKELTEDKVVKKICKWLDLQFTSENYSQSTGLSAEDDDTPKPKKIAERLLSLTEDFSLFHTFNRDTYAKVPIKEHFENIKLTSKDFQLHLARLLWEDSKQTINSQSLQDALSVLRGRALFESPIEEVYIRFAEKDKAIFVDLGNETWQAIKVTENGWEVIESNDVPVKFRRTRGILPLPTPTINHNGLNELKNFVNIADDDFVLLCVWAVSAMRPGFAFPVLAIAGGQGSAKSTLTKVLRDLIDPNTSALRSQPRSERDLMIAARNSWILSFDNLSKLSNNFSDSLCRLATGGGLATRQLHSDDDEIIFDAKRPLIINGINDLATRSDLLERCLILNLPTIDSARRQDEATFNRNFNEAKPRLFGALLDKLSESLRELPNVKLAEKPRMADFAEFAFAGFGKEFLDRYTSNRDDANEIALQNSPLGEALLKFFEKLIVPQWEGTAKNLLDKLVEAADVLTIQDKDFPKKPNILSAELKRIEPNLLAIGWKVGRSRGGDKKRVRQIMFTRIENSINQLSAPSAPSTIISNVNKPLDLNDKHSSIVGILPDDKINVDAKKNGNKSHHPSIKAVNTEVKANMDNMDDTDDEKLQSSHTLLKVEEEREIIEI